MEQKGKTILEAEVIYGALRRERFWQLGFGIMTLCAVAAIGAASTVVVSYRPPAPILIPFDPATGLAVPNASVTGVSLDERTAVVQSLFHQYVTSRETYNQIDNDLRINRVLARTTGTARQGLLRLWDSGSEDYLPKRYGTRTQVEVVINSITLLGENRIQVRMRKQLSSPDGTTVGNFTAVASYDFTAIEETTLEAVWQNPLGFTVSEYQLYKDRRE